MIKGYLITSQITFVPENYNRLVIGLASHPAIQGLIVLDNRSLEIFKNALLLIASAAGPQMGLQLLKNWFGSSASEREQAYRAQGKKVHTLSALNSAEGYRLIESLQPDLLLNARTREIFPTEILSIPRLGCFNIHHGLLPNQRGLMCDFWSHIERLPTGFSVHRMTEKIDAGEILATCEVPLSETSFADYLLRASISEKEVVGKLLDQWNHGKDIHSRPNIQEIKQNHRRNPSVKDFYFLRRQRGIKV